MKYSLILLAGLVAISCILACGCTQPAQTPAQTPVTTVQTPPPTTLPVTTLVTPVSTPADIYSLSPEPTRALLAYADITYQINREQNTKTPVISVIINGGPGLGLIKTVAVKAVRPDGTVTQGSANHPGMGTSVDVMGSPTKDRVVIWITLSSGETYKIFDQNVLFATRGG
ncbi:hypothetical protein [Methanoregula sp.]|uniref:hypothetical protein n=1 Tax=Methanoregula sp. TaxID=2052170 RepID=UPI000CB4AC56|nr:hypothetical protein [Methanoregula sp.]PKG31557.1 MAG: hypothetical protein CW742_12795 [Methanoregula sp.]